jgi:aminoglycoside phosphotransferase family enzyme
MNTDRMLIANLSTPDLAARLAFLRRPGAFPGPPHRIEVVETHLSWVFLTEDRVYKLKKPIAHEHVDLTTIEGRHKNCLEELRLNRRLAPQIYLDVVPLTLASDRGLRLGGDGPAVDWLVVMKRLPVEATLRARLPGGLVSPQDIERIADRLTTFYRAATTAPTDPDQYCQRFVDRIGRESETLLDQRFDLPVARIRTAASRARAFLDRHRDMLRARARDGRIVEAHGDLRPEHIFLMPEPVIIDCLEFSHELRLLDPAEELAYLAMECAHLGARWVRDTLFAAYCARSGDMVPSTLIDFHWTFRALLRARLAIAHLKDDVVRDPIKWRRQALGYLDLANEGSG